MSRIGIDIGRVIIGPSIGGVADTRFLGATLAAAMHTPPAPGAFDTIAALVARHGGQVWLVSKCGPSVQTKTRAWLEHHQFWSRTGLDREHLRFCLHRPEKADHARALGLDVMVDDRVDVLEHLRGLVPELLLFGEQRGPAPPWTTHVADWAAVARWFGAPPDPAP